MAVVTNTSRHDQCMDRDATIEIETHRLSNAFNCNENGLHFSPETPESVGKVCNGWIDSNMSIVQQTAHYATRESIALDLSRRVGYLYGKFPVPK